MHCTLNLTIKMELNAQGFDRSKFENALLSVVTQNLNVKFSYTASSLFTFCTFKAVCLNQSQFTLHVNLLVKMELDSELI